MSSGIYNGLDASYTGVRQGGKWQIRLDAGKDKGKTTFVDNPPYFCDDQTEYMDVAVIRLQSARCYLRDSRHGMALKQANEAFALVRLQVGKSGSLEECRFWLERLSMVAELVYRIESCLNSRLSGKLKGAQSIETVANCRRSEKQLLIKYEGG